MNERGEAAQLPDGSLLAGAEYALVVDVRDHLLTSFWEGAPPVDVLATPSLVSLFEQAADKAVAPLVPPSSITLGLSVCVEHRAAVPAGESVAVRAQVTEVEGRRVSYQLTATWNDTLVATGTHTRAVVDRQRFLDSLDKRR